jgi:hypothetical protein
VPSYRYALSLIRAVPDTPRPKLLLSRAIGALTARGPFTSHSTTDVAGCNGSGRRLASVCAGQHPCGAPPAEIEPATPSLSAIGGSTLCNPAFLQVVRDRRGSSNALFERVREE